MPFHERFSYRSREILCIVIGGAIDEANHRATALRHFAKPTRVEVPMAAEPITDETESWRVISS
jgi:hypothetical protein